MAKKTKNELAREAFRRRARLRGNAAAGTHPVDRFRRSSTTGEFSAEDPTKSRQVKVGNKGRSRTTSTAKKKKKRS
jgi:hypothetical protein